MTRLDLLAPMGEEEKTRMVYLACIHCVDLGRMERRIGWFDWGVGGFPSCRYSLIESDILY